MSAPALVGPSPQRGGPVPSPDWDDLLADIGDRIRAERQARGWTQALFALRAGIGLNTVKRLEDGTATLRGFAQACHALDVDMAHVLSPDWRIPSRKAPLTARQAEILTAVADGQTLAAAAADLGVAREELASRLSKIYVQLGVTNVPRDERRTAAVRLATESGLIYAA